MADVSSFPSKTATLNGLEYFYIDQPAQGKQKDTIVLVHGWPDSWYGWRRQIPFLSKEGYRVLCISQVGFGAGTACPTDLHRYTSKSVCEDLKALLNHEKIRRAIFAGHDWGGAIVYRMANYHPELVVALMAVSTPYFAPAKGNYLSLEEMAKLMPNFAYQVYLASDRSAKDFVTRDDFRKFFNALFQPGKGMRLNMQALAASSSHEPTPLLTEAEMEVYISQYVQTGFQSSTNWYRTRKLNFDNDVKDFSDSDGTLKMPVLFIATNLDPVLKPELSRGMEKLIPKLMRKSIETGHWGLIEAHEEVNAYMGEFLQRLYFEKMRHQI